MITPTQGKNSDTLDPKIDFYPFLGESVWDLLSRCRERILALASRPEPEPLTREGVLASLKRGNRDADDAQQALDEGEP